jgi:hypothetical protein
MHKSVLLKLPKTFNSLEGLHRSLNERIIKKAPSLFQLFKKLQYEQNNTEIKIIQNFYAEVKDDGFKNVLEEVCNDYSNFYGVNFLLRIASVMKLKFE